MVPRLLKPLAGRSASSGGKEPVDGRNPELEQRNRSGSIEAPLPSAWVKMHVWRRDGGKCVGCGG